MLFTLMRLAKHTDLNRNITTIFGSYMNTAHNLIIQLVPMPREIHQKTKLIQLNLETYLPKLIMLIVAIYPNLFIDQN